MNWVDIKACAEEAAKLAPIGTACIATLAALIALWSLCTQKGIARRRAAIDFFLKTEMDEKMLDAHKRFRCAVKALNAEPDIETFANTDEYRDVCSYLNVHELMATGVHGKVFHGRICRSYWMGELERACRDCNRVLLYLRNDPAEKLTYVELQKLNSKWQRGW
jgi:hypothetical protein